MLEIYPLKSAPTSCEPCMFGSSPPGSSHCFHCPINNYAEKGTNNCIPCDTGKMAVPGSDTCTIRPTCSMDYDVIQTYQNCINGQRQMTNIFRNESFCDKSKFSFPTSPITTSCSSCNPGSFIQAGSPTNCGPCAKGEYSNVTNSIQCNVCPAGSYAPFAAIYKNLEEMPNAFESTCEQPIGETTNVCAFLKGWIIAKGTFTVLPNFPGKSKLLLKTRVNITDEIGELDFNYILEERPVQVESLKVRIDGELSGKIKK